MVLVTGDVSVSGPMVPASPRDAGRFVSGRGGYVRRVEGVGCAALRRVSQSPHILLAPDRRDRLALGAGLVERVERDSSPRPSRCAGRSCSR